MNCPTNLGDLSRSQVLIFNVIRLDHFQKCISEKERVLTVIKTEAHFVKVGFNMLC
jgi:hypothetical protein